MMSPSRILPSVNFQPSSTHRTMPSSRTRLVEAIKKESAFTGWAPLTSTEREAASAANEQEDETNPKKLASPAFVGPRSEERRVGKEFVSTCRSRGWPDH